MEKRDPAKRICRQCLACRDLAGCMEVWDCCGSPYPDYDCLDFRFVGLREFLRRWWEVFRCPTYCNR